MSGITHITIPAEILKLPVQGLYAICILALIHNFNPKGLRLSNSKIAEALSVDKRTVERAISRLKKAGFIEDSGKGKNDRCLVLRTDKLSADTDKTTGNSTDKLSAEIPTSEGASTDILADHNKEVSNNTSVDSKFSFMLATGERWRLPQVKFEEYQNTYPTLDVEAELRKAGQWLSDNPKRRKTKKGMTRFLGGWLSRAKPTQPAQPEHSTRAVSQAEADVLMAEVLAQ